MIKDKIIIKGARIHNLKNITVEIPKNKLVVITGISGSGKSSLAFDTLYAEGQRRYVESLSAYARQFLGVMQKPDVDYIEGISPAIAIGQRTPSKNPRSTVGTVTEIYDYLRLLFARIGIPHCWKCGRKITSQTIDQIVDKIMEFPEGTKFQILAPVVRGRKGEYTELFQKLQRKGYVRLRIDGKIYTVETLPRLERYKKHTIEIIVDRLVMPAKGGSASGGKNGIRHRIADSVETALKEGEDMIIINSKFQNPKSKSQTSNLKSEYIFSTKLTCPLCGISYEEISPRMFSFNSPYGACPTCTGLGTKLDIDPDLLVPDKSLSINQGAIKPCGHYPSRYWGFHTLGINLNTPYKDLPEDIKQVVLYGDTFVEENKRCGQYCEGVIPNLLRRYKETDSDWIRREIEEYMAMEPCPDCQGTRLKKESLSIKIKDKNISDITSLSIRKCADFFNNLSLNKTDQKIAEQIIKETKARLDFLLNVGLDYLTLSRKADTLSGGEDERVRLATQIGSGLVGVVYILDEPTIGLHQRDNARLLHTLKELKEMGNTVVVVEHDKNVILSSDYVIDLGPGAGEYGGKVVATGTPLDIMSENHSLTGDYLSGRKSIKIPDKRKKPENKFIIIKGARHNNLKSIDVKIPLGLFTCITGVSGSGKSSLINDTLYRALARHFYHSRYLPGKHDSIEGLEYIDKVVNIDQSPIGRTPRSNPATYTGVFTPIRELFTELRESRIRGYRPGRFSFNVRGGRCEACEGDGTIRVEMHFLPDIYITCEACKGKRFNNETLEITYKGKNISEVLRMTVTEAMEHFKNIPLIMRKLQLLYDVGLGYIQLGQSAPTLSGGEAQRIKLAKELSKVATGKTLYLLDEPTTGLHFEDVKMLLNVLNRLTQRGNTVLVIEHNPEVIKCADWVIDLGPEGGDAGGEIVAQGPPEHIIKCKKSYTGAFLKKELAKRV